MTPAARRSPHLRPTGEGGRGRRRDDPLLPGARSAPGVGTQRRLSRRPAPAERIRFIKRAQELGFSLDDVAELLDLEDGADRRSIRHIATDRLAQIEHKLADLRRMQRVLKHLVVECEHADAGRPCPIIGSLSPAWS